MKKTILDTSIITLQNIVGHSVKTMVGFTDGNQLDIPSDFVDVVVIGNVHQDTNEYGLFQYVDASLLLLSICNNILTVSMSRLLLIACSKAEVEVYAKRTSANNVLSIAM